MSTRAFAAGAATATATEVPLKVVLRVSRGEEVRRVTFTGDWAQLGEQLQRWAGAPVVVRYLDAEGDEVTVSSAAEWDECVRLWDRSAPLRLVCAPVRGGARRVAEEGSEALSAAGGALQELLRRAVVAADSQGRCAARRAREAAPELWLASHALAQQGLRALQQCEAGAAEAFFALQTQVAPQDGTAEYNLACAIAMREPHTEAQSDRAAAALRRAVAKGYCNAEHMAADPDLVQLRSRADWGELLQAARDAAGSQPCAAAAEAPQEAVESAAVDGAAQVNEQPQPDSAVEQPRQEEAPAEAAAPLEPQQPSVDAQPQAQSQQQQEDAAPAPQPPCDPAVRTLLDMGLCDAECAAAVLRRCGGDLRAAVQFLLEQ